MLKEEKQKVATKLEKEKLLFEQKIKEEELKRQQMLKEEKQKVEAAFEEKNKLMTQKLKEMHAKVEELTLHNTTAEEQKATLYNDAKAEAAKAHALAMEEEI